MPTITKSDILDALRTEPLSAGRWINDRNRDNGPCKVCAVGAVIRQKLPALAKRAFEGTWKDISEFNDVCAEITDHQFCGDMWAGTAPAGNYLSALSILWEYLNAKNPGAPIKELRAILVDWAEENIPNTYQVHMRGVEGTYTFKHKTAKG